MRLVDQFRFNLQLFVRHRVRTLLLLLAVGAGVASVILLTSLGEGARRYIDSEFSSLGNNLLIVLPGKKETTGGTPPTISATRRPDNAPSEVLEVFIDGDLPRGETTTFTFDTGTGPQAIAYFRERPEVPATSVWGLVLLTLAALIVGAATFRLRLSAPV